MAIRATSWSTTLTQEQKDHLREADLHELRLRRVRDYVTTHAPSAARVSDLHEGRMTTRQFEKFQLIYFTAHERGPEFILAERVFRKDVCGRMSFQAVLRSLWKEGLLNRSKASVLVGRPFPDPLNWARVVSINPDILKYRTTADEIEAEERAFKRKERRRRQREARLAAERRKKHNGPPGPWFVLPMFRDASRRD
jgi:hypothetical protein